LVSPSIDASSQTGISTSTHRPIKPTLNRCSHHSISEAKRTAKTGAHLLIESAGFDAPKLPVFAVQAFVT
jgi:hypothetical protein